ncbi:hypothetical protein jhhlp_005965 [Lomentospora prolificans]|uniref:Phosphoglycerate mutase n=1 Tax=Lomentospora prolificans TaxID=41688 RepID=A0A2N3N4K5_9PEZI|nr:hypothetical protein jhhlp_005965 [Lomentospora prolificans]
MGKPPAYIFVVRHGNRLDVVDKDWVLTSATPYDPPLTYGGWLQARTVGGKIASIITQAEAEYDTARNRASEDEHSAGIAKRKPRRRLFKVAIHSSPFLRCIQTAVAITAGLREPPGTPAPYPRQTRSNSVASVHSVSRPLVRRGTASPVLSPISTDPNMNPLDANPRFDHRLFPRSVLRLDAFLGEWLSPAYFETITPPPSTSAMLSSAKADLLRREDYSKYSDPGLRPKPTTAKSQLWQSKEEDGSGTKGPLNAMGSLANALSEAAQPQPRPPPMGYIAPVPHYAITNNCKIPDGYVAHARDACSTVDYTWDSTGPPLAFGDGGMYGEEWTAMHKRFRRGLQNLVDWYASCDNPTELKWTLSTHSNATKEAGSGSDMANGHAGSKTANSHSTKKANTEEEDVEEESVVILVSHGAGCNALIGAITHQPALMDVGVASITMAVRKGDGYEVEEPEWNEASGSIGNSDAAETPRATPAVHLAYDLKMTASSEHLRGAPTAPASPILGHSARSASMGGGFRGRVNTMSSTESPVLRPFTYADSFNHSGSGSRSSSMSASVNFGPTRRTSKGPSYLSNDPLTPGSGFMTFAAPTSAHSRVSSLGLWSPVRDEDEDDYFPDFDNKRFERRTTNTSSLGQTWTAPSKDGGLPLDLSSTAILPDTPPARPLGPSRQASEASDDYMTTQLGFTPSAGGGGGAGGLWSAPRVEPRRRWTINER